MRFDEVLKEMVTSDSPKVAKLPPLIGTLWTYITIVRPTPDEMQFVQLHNGSTYSHLGSREILSDKWEWA